MGANTQRGDLPPVYKEGPSGPPYREPSKNAERYDDRRDEQYDRRDERYDDRRQQQVGAQYAEPPPDRPAVTYGFDERKVRHKFIRKVYSILLLQLLLMVAIIVTIMFIPGIQLFVRKYWWLSFIIMGAWFAVSILLTCYCSRNFPWNIILLTVLSVLNGIALGFLCAISRTDYVLIAFGLTVGIVLALTLFAFQTRCDFTGWGTYLFIASLLLLVIGLVGIFVRHRILHIVYCSLGVGVYCIYLIYNTQLLLGGKHKAAISPEDYVVAALHLLIDMVMLFQYLLSLLNLTGR